MRLWQTNVFEKPVMTHGDGCRVWDKDGNRYLDMTSGTWCRVLGYNHPRLTEAIRHQAGKQIHAGMHFVSEEIERALEKLTEILPPALNRAVFLNTGSEAVELALKMARAATGSDRFAVVERSYYGATTYALTLSEVGRGAHYLPTVGTVLRVPAPDCRRCPAGVVWPCGEFHCLGSLRSLASKNGVSIAAVLFEPVLANGGVIVPPEGYGARLRELARRCGALFIAEEVTTGIGRTGRWFGFEHEGIVPDILVVAKALGAGLPVAAVVTTDDVEARCRGAVSHIQSHQNDPFSGRIAAEVISIMQDEELVDRAAAIGKRLLSGLWEIKSRRGCIADVRGKGALLGIELRPDCAERGSAIAARLLEEGFIVNYQPHNVAFRLFPPYVISDGDLDLFLEAFDDAFAYTES